MLINEWINGSTKCVMPIQVLFSHKKEWCSATGYTMDEPWEQYAKWKKPLKGTYCLIPSYEIPRIGKSTETERRLMVAGGWGKRRNGECLFNGYKISFWGDEMYLKLDIGDSYTLLMY